MNEPLKIFLQKHRDALDEATPGAHGWSGLERMLERLPESDALERQLMCDRILLDTEAPSGMVWAGIEKELDGSMHTHSLESFIQQNREAFDVELPNDQAWGNISRNLPKPRAIKVHIGWQRSIMRIAASLALLISGVGGGIWYERQAASNQGMAMGEVSGEYRELEQFYQREISTKRDKLATFTGNQPAEVGEDLEHLDEIMAELKQDLSNVPPGNREQVIHAMIENYKAKMAILQRVLERLGQSKDGGDNRKLSNGIKNI